VPVTSLCVIERRKGKDKPVIKKALTELEGPLSQPCTAYMKIRDELRMLDAYEIPGPIQYDMENCKSSTDIPMTLQLELGREMKALVKISEPKKMGDFLYAPQSVEARSSSSSGAWPASTRSPQRLPRRALPQSGCTRCRPRCAQSRT